MIRYNSLYTKEFPLIRLSDIQVGDQVCYSLDVSSQPNTTNVITNIPRPGYMTMTCTEIKLIDDGKTTEWTFQRPYVNVHRDTKTWYAGFEALHFYERESPNTFPFRLISKF